MSTLQNGAQKFHPIQNKTQLERTELIYIVQLFYRHDLENKCFAYSFRPTPCKEKLITTSLSQEITI
jgi:hypothetical protein